ncbi:unnamed protein product [Oppiella nova]|uniref:TIL domain-containing protein n=1 Tax=Oppiella nova TaxID=334625 RepID=A0A7R9MG40_9ACAR|nr:unnamed protein product [Oppiella nova]CAG2176696.1 unnamed protein product [Oppiella nova]
MAISGRPTIFMAREDILSKMKLLEDNPLKGGRLAALTGESCKKANEEHTKCGSCEKSCADRDKEMMCASVCREGCFCKKGYVRDANKDCIEPDKCPK